MSFATLTLSTFFKLRETVVRTSIQRVVGNSGQDLIVYSFFIEDKEIR